MILIPINGRDYEPDWFTTELLSELLDQVHEHIGFSDLLEEMSLTWVRSDVTRSIAIPTHDMRNWSVVCILARDPHQYNVLLELANAFCRVALEVHPDDPYSEVTERSWQVASFIATMLYDKT